MYGAIVGKAVGVYRRRHRVLVQRRYDTRKCRVRRAYRVYNVGGYWLPTKVVRPYIPFTDRVVGGLSSRGFGRGEHALRVLEAGVARPFGSHVAESSFGGERCDEACVGESHGFVRGDQPSSQGDRAFAPGASIASSTFDDSGVGGDEDTLARLFRRVEWRFCAEFLTPCELIRLTHTHRLEVPDWLWRSVWSGSNPRVACQVCYLVEVRGALALARSILTERAALMCAAALYRLGYREALFELFRFTRVYRKYCFATDTINMI